MSGVRLKAATLHYRITCHRHTVSTLNGTLPGLSSGLVKPENPPRLVEEILNNRPYPEQGYKTCLGIINLTRNYDPVRVEVAAKRAFKFRTCSYRSMKTILASGLDRQPDDEQQPVLPGLLPHQNIRGPEYYQ